MASYWEWNEAIAGFFGRGLSSGEVFYLSVDEDTLIEIGAAGFAGPGPPDAVRDFEAAIREECVAGRQVSLPPVQPRRMGGPPSCLAFLTAMVLAAYRMAPEDDIAEINYFSRMREVLGMGEGRGRPPGLNPPGAPEERLWTAFNNWVLSNGWQPSAERGADGPMKFTNYPLSQSLLREGDKGKLERDFRSAESELGRYSDRERVGAWFLNRATSFATKHIRNLAQEATTDRYDSIADVVYDVYASIDWDAPSYGDGESVRRYSPRRLTAGLYRDFNPLFGATDYLLFPRRQVNQIRGTLHVMRGGTPEPLRRERDGQFRPLWPVNPAGGETYPVTGDPRIAELHLPARSFWVLTLDRFDDSSGIFASRGAPRLGETFLLLCRNECQEQLDVMRDEGLLRWDSGPVDVLGCEGWAEYRECIVLSANWDGIIPQLQELFDELRPRHRASISLHGGLKTGGRNTWIEGHLPELSITSFDWDWQVRVTNVSQPNDEPVLDYVVNANALIDLAHLAPGGYRVEVLSNGRPVDGTYITVLSWDSLEPSNPAETFGTPVGEYLLNGGLLTETTSTSDLGGELG